MLTQSKEVQNAWRASQRTLDIKVTIDGKTYGATDINSLKYDSGAYNGDTFAIGSTYSNTVQIEFSHLVEGLKLGMEVRPSIGIKTSSGYVYEPLGVFIISSEIKMDRNNNLTTVSASDRFCGLEGAYVSKLTYPAKVLDVIAEICAQSGVKANADDLARLPHQVDLPAPITGQSYRKALGWIAQLYVGYALFDRQGLFTIRTISEPNYELDPSQYEQAGLTKNEAAYKINGIQCQVTLTTKTRDGESTEETKTYQAGDATGSQIKLENNIMTPQRLNDIWEQLKALTFYPFSLNWFGNPAVEAGDWLRLEDKQGNSFVVPNSSYTLDFNGGLSATSKADQTTSSDQMVPWQGSVAQTIKELQLRRSPDGTVVFPPSVTEPPTNAKFNDVWFKKNGNSTELWIFEKQDDGSGKWIRKDFSDDEIKKKVADAQQGLNQAKADIINNKQKADADIENLNKSIETNKKVADESLQKLNDSVTNLQGQYDNNVVPNLNKAMADASDALQKYISAQNSIADLTKQAQQQRKDIADVTNTVKGLNINYANLAGDVNSTKVDVKGLQTTVGTANGDITQLKLDAQNLQTMLAGKVDNTTYANFVNLTNQALNARLTASDLNGYAKTADVQATANGLQVDLNSVTDRINNLKVGTSNLLHHSDTFDGWIKGYSVTVTADKYLDGRIAILGGAGVDGGQLTTYLDGPYNDDLVTWVVYAKADNAGDKLHTELWGGGGYTDQSLTTKWQAYKFSGHRNINHHDFYLWGCVGNKGNIYVALPFAVVGNTIGTWGPNASDINHDLNELSAQVNITNQQFNSYYTKSEADNRTNSAKNDAINAIRSDSNWQGLNNILTNSGFLQTADGFLQKVQQTTQPIIDANNGGGINLVRMSSFHNVTLDQLRPYWNIQDHVWINVKGGYTGTGSIVIDTRDLSGNEYRDITQSITLEPDTDYRISLKFDYAAMIAGKTFNAATFLVEYDSNGKLVTPYRDNGRPLVNSNQRSMNSFVIHTSPTTYKGLLYIRSFAGTQIEFEEIKIERGKVETPYSQAPADNVTQIAFAALTQSLEGLRSTVSSNYGELQTTNSQTATAIRTELNNKIIGVQNQITTTANGLNLTIGNLMVGGGNLLHNSDTFEGWHITGNVKIDNSTYLNGKIAILPPGPGVVNELCADPFDGPFTNEIATWVIYARSAVNGDKLHTELYGGGGFTNQPLTTEWKKYRFTGNRDARIKQLHFWGLAENRGNVYVALPILSEGSVQKSWEPNPNDMATRKDFVALDVTLKGLQSTVSSNHGELQSQLSQTASTLRGELVDKANGIQNQITATANSLNVRIGDLTVGGGNLLHNSDTFEGWHKGSTVSIAGSKYLNGAVAILAPGGSGGNALESASDSEPSNQNLTWTVLARADNAGDKLHTELWGGGGLTEQPLTTEWKKYRFTGRQNQNNKSFYLWGCQGNKGNINVALPMLYSGSIDRDWAMNSDDAVVKNNLLAQINMSAGTTLIQNDKIYMDASSTIFSGNAFIPSAAITSLNADKITAGTINAANVNIINLNANNITTGTINGQNLKINLDTGNVEFQHGHIHNFSNSVDIDLDQNYISVSSWSTKAMLKNGELQLIQPQLFDLSSDPYFRLYNGGSGSDWSAAYLEGRSGIFISPKGYKGNSVLDTLGILGQNTWAGFYTGYENGGALSPTSIGGADKGVVIHGGAKLTQTSNIFSGDGGTALADTPHIHIGTDGSGRFGGNRIVIEGEYLHVPTAWRHTTGDAPNLFIANDGALVRSTSASKYKTEIHRDYSTNYGDRLLELPTATWIDKGQKERYQAGQRSIKPKKYFGMIAEDLADAGLDLLVSKNADGEIEGIQYERIAPALIPVIRKLKKKVQQLEEKLNE